MFWGSWVFVWLRGLEREGRVGGWERDKACSGVDMMVLSMYVPARALIQPMCVI